MISVFGLTPLLISILKSLIFSSDSRQQWGSLSVETLHSNGNICFRNFCINGMFSVEVTKSGKPELFSAYLINREGPTSSTSEAMSLVDSADYFDLIALEIVTH